jgi:hypothetical protein
MSADHLASMTLVPGGLVHRRGEVAGVGAPLPAVGKRMENRRQETGNGK